MPVVETRRETKIGNVLFMISLFFLEGTKGPCLVKGAALSVDQLVCWTISGWGERRATGLTRARVGAVPSAIGRGHEGEGRQRLRRGRVDAVAEQCPVRGCVDQHARHDALSDIHNVVI